MNPNGKSEKNNTTSYVSLRNKQVSDIKETLGLFMTGAEASNVGINTLVNWIKCNI